MKRKYYLNSIGYSLVYLFITLFLCALIIAVFFTDEFHLFLVIALIFLIVAAVITLFWACYSFTMRIEIDYENKILYIRYWDFIKKISFDDIVSIEILEQTEVELVFTITMNNFFKRIAYTRYYKSRPTIKIKRIINDLKNDLLSITGNN